MEKQRARIVTPSASIPTVATAKQRVDSFTSFALERPDPAARVFLDKRGNRLTVPERLYNVSIPFLGTASRTLLTPSTRSLRSFAPDSEAPRDFIQDRALGRPSYQC